MASKPYDRQCLERYFHHKTMIDRPWWGWMLSLLQAAAVLAVLGLFLLDGPLPGPETLGRRVLEALLAASLVFALTGLVKYLILHLHKLAARAGRHQSLATLETQVREVVRHDYKRALKAIVKQSGLKPGDLKAIGSSYRDPLEHRLFSDTEIRNYLGLMTDQTMRMTTPYGPEPDFAATTDNRLLGRGFFLGYFMPVRLICLFFTDTELVIGTCVFDSHSGDLQTKIQRLPGDSFKGLTTKTEETRHAIDKDRMLNWLAEHQFTAEEEKAIAMAFRAYDRDQTQSIPSGSLRNGAPYVLHRQTKYLMIERQGGSPLRLPMQMKHMLRRDLPGDSRGRPKVLFPLAAEARAARRAAPATVRDTEGKHGRRGSAPHLEYKAGWSLVSDLAAAIVVFFGCLAVLHVISDRHTIHLATSTAEDILVERGGADRPRIEPWQNLPDTLRARVRDDDAWTFGCSNTSTVLKNAASWRAANVLTIPDGYPVAIQIENEAENGAELPEGWRLIELAMDGEVRSGFAAGDYFDEKSTAGPLVCVSD